MSSFFIIASHLYGGFEMRRRHPFVHDVRHSRLDRTCRQGPANQQLIFGFPAFVHTLSYLACLAEPLWSGIADIVRCHTTITFLLISKIRN